MKPFRNAECGLRNGPTLTLVLALALGILLTPLAAEAQQAGKVYRIGLLSTGMPPTPATPNPYFETFWQRLRDLGYVEPQNLVIESRWAEGKSERLPALAAELVQLKPDVIVTAASPAAVAVKNATSTIPVVMASSLDPVREGIVASLARPGGNVTGMMLVSDPDIIAKRLQVLKEALPRMSRLAIVPARRPFSAAQIIWLKDTEAAAKVLGVQVQIVEVQDPSNWDDAFAAMVRSRADALYPIEAPSYAFHRKYIAASALKKRMPTMFGVREHVEAGGLMSYGADLRDVYRRAAAFVDKILKGAKPGDLPVEQPTKFELVINLKTAKALGLTIPHSILIRADQVIQ